jgi:hypothetical protein
MQNCQLLRRELLLQYICSVEVARPLLWSCAQIEFQVYDRRKTSSVLSWLTIQRPAGVKMVFAVFRSHFSPTLWNLTNTALFVINM